MGTPFPNSARREEPHPEIPRPETLPDRTNAPGRARVSGATFVGIAALLVATSVMFSALLSSRNIPTYRDLLFFTWPLKHFLHERLLGGHIPLWNPLLLMGTPYLANLQSGVFYPPSLLLLLPLPLGFNLFLFAHYLIALFGAWAWLRARNLNVVPAAIGTAVFTLGGYLVSLLNLTNHLQAAAWAPWVLFCWSRFASTARGRDCLWLIAALCMAFLGGSPENFFLTLTVVAAWTAYSRWTAWREMARLFSYLLLASVATAALCAVQVLPTIEYLGQSLRAGALPFGHVAQYSFQPVSALQLLLPHSPALLPTDAVHTLGPSFEGETPLIESYYLGIVPLCLAIVGITKGRERLLWTFVVVVGIVMALGAHAPVFPALYHALPQIFGKFRYPEKFYFLVHLGGAVLAAEGAQVLLAGRSDPVRIALVACWTLLSIGVILCALRWLWPADYLELIAVVRGRYLPPSAFVPLALDAYWKAQRLVLVLGGLIVLLVLPSRILRPNTSCWLLLSLALVDLVSANRNFNQAMSWASLESRPLLIDPAAVRDRGERIFHGQVAASGAPQRTPRLTWWVPMISRNEDLDATYRLLWETMNSDAGMLYGIANVYGSDGITSASDDLLLQVMAELPLDRAVKLLRIFGAGYVLGPGPLPAESVVEVPAERDTPYRAFRIRNPLPLVYAVSQLRVEPSRAAALFRMSGDDFDPRREAIVEALPAGWRAGGTGEAAPSVTMLARSDELWRFRVDATMPALVVVNESFFPGWEARIDGSPTPIVRTNGIVRGLAVGAGTHQVELAYRPRSFRWGAVVSLASALAFAAAAALSSYSRKRRGALG